PRAGRGGRAGATPVDRAASRPPPAQRVGRGGPGPPVHRSPLLRARGDEGGP
ncbi:MAG: hypothetical protein AMXMBFR46_28540, partial [Acidimicrobiia bacterium]